ncbi:hypothetical protein C8N32_10494 [Rhodovulum imhoffii]|uniref:Uncharacterized protein n=1 Tax=Rhodovulum imhoffii TaxID=365340 RepID=A0A2T5BU30_9RHOB|nr:hypothetical protein [Rhodovulum imhoffii]MBK5934600.1 hypothetical protein [Rhodovulum imhoffii]PTN02983.1 hypothetical protein C8N32_10494 [Rhodovulum imhoffii]
MAVVETSRLEMGQWVVLLTGKTAPVLDVLHNGKILATPKADPAGENRWRMALVIPSEVLSDGVQTLILRDCARGDTLARLAIRAGEPLEQDVLADLDLLRAELEMLKAAFRRHLRED